MSVMNSIAQKTRQAADATERAAKSTKLKGEIMLIEKNIRNTKEKFGVEVYTAMVSADRATTEHLFNETRRKVEGYEADIAAKRERIQSLKHAGGGHGHGGEAQYGQPPGGGYGAPPPQQATNPAGAPGSWGAPPVGPPPGGPPGGAPGLPPGWKQASTPEGKVYYYHQTTGETSWSVPVS